MFVYWLFDVTCSIPQTEGYVGVTNNMVRRLREHRRKRSGFQSAILLEGSDEECFSLERDLRPRPSIGWNNGAGGPDARKSGHSAETRARIGKGAEGNTHMRGKKQSLETRAKISAALKGRKGHAPSAAFLASRPVAPHTGHKHSDASKKKMNETHRERPSLGFVGRKHSEETKAIIRAKRALQADPRLGRKHSEESIELMRLNRRKDTVQDGRTGRFVK
jgi:NUMOD3 motif